MSYQWHRRLGDLLGSIYRPLMDVEQSRLPGTDFKPHRVDYLGEGYEEDSYWRWPSLDGSGETSASPASSWSSGIDPTKGETRAMLQRATEAFELPGTVSDYHFILLNVYQRLWRDRRSEVGLAGLVEMFCRLDVELVCNQPESIRLDRGDRTYLHVPAFQYLVTLYLDEGYLRDALEVAATAERFDQEAVGSDELIERIRVLEAEDA